MAVGFVFVCMWFCAGLGSGVPALVSGRMTVCTWRVRYVYEGLILKGWINGRTYYASQESMYCEWVSLYTKRR
jgi:hypothetical protein